jgi:hypothetical protein
MSLCYASQPFRVWDFEAISCLNSLHSVFNSQNYFKEDTCSFSDLTLFTQGKDL